MKFRFTYFIPIFFLFILNFSLEGQNLIKGRILDKGTREPLIGATILVKGTNTGTLTEFDGSFELLVDRPFPFKLEFSYTGYSMQELDVLDNSSIRILLEEEAVNIDLVEVTGRRISEKQKQSALTVETLDNIAIRETPAANFYDGLGSLKDVDLTAASLGFKIINTRGFNSTSPVRSLQIIDGVDNQSPGLNFSLGNFLGASELDVNRVNLVVGASSAFFGPNAFNGVISMETKDPFLHKGLSAMIKGGERNLLEGGIRYAKVIENKNKMPAFAFKLNVFGFRANDWVADNYDPIGGSDSGIDNPGGYDAVNIYGDEPQPGNNFSGSLGSPGLGRIYRQGYKESDLVDYDSENLKVGGAFHWRLKPELDLESPTLILATNYSTGTTVYQGDNRFSLRDIQFFQHRIELKKQDKYFLRFYATHEDAGNSYDPYFTALLLQENAKEGRFWTSAYKSFWDINIVPKIRAIEGFPSILNYLGRPDDFRAALEAFYQNPNYRDNLSMWHEMARTAADAENALVNAVAFYEPGTDRFNEEFRRITSSISFTEGGTRFYDKSALYHGHGEYQFTDLVQTGRISDLDIVIGGNFRYYAPDSRGSILLDTFGRNIDTKEFGLYTGGTLEIDGKLKVNGSIRLDKNQNFEYLVSPAASLVYSPNTNQTFRASFSSAIRNPTLADQYLFYNVGRAILIGNLDGFENLITVESFRTTLNRGRLDSLEYFDVAPIRPEKVKTFEVGYRSTIGQHLFVDATYYYSFYKDFIGFNLGIDAAFDQTTSLPVSVQAYRVAANARDQVTTQGFSIGANYYFAKYFVVNGNYSWNRLNTQTDDPIIPAFNTPEHKYNIGISGREVPFQIGKLRLNNFGFNVNYKWVDTFIFEGSPQFTGIIPSYGLLDAQINWKLTGIDTVVKLGASNLLNNLVFQTYGGPRIGRLAYISFLFELKNN
jgi:iron complex outermembrane recepter protein